MAVIQSSTRRRGRWLAALLLLPVQHVSSLSDQILKDVDYPVLPLFGPLLTVCTTEARRRAWNLPVDGKCLTLAQCAARSHHLPLPAEQRGDSPLWEIKPSPGKGRGLFAAQEILKGTHVLVETPLLAVSPPALVPGMGYSLSAMAADVEREYSRLSAEQQEEYLSCHEQRLEGDGRDELGRLMAILRSNAYNLDDGRVAMYPKVALINHSCQPNVLNADNRGTRVIVATRDIREGEEVCSSRYLPPHRQPHH